MHGISIIIIIIMYTLLYYNTHSWMDPFLLWTAIIIY